MAQVSTSSLVFFFLWIILGFRPCQALTGKYEGNYTYGHRTVADYFVAKAFRHVIVCSCAGVKENLRLQYALNDHLISSVFLPSCGPSGRSEIEDLEGLHRIFDANARLAVYVDGNCPDLDEVLDIFRGCIALWAGTRAWLLGGGAAALSAARRLPLALHADLKIMFHVYDTPILLDVWSVQASRGAPYTASLHSVHGDLAPMTTHRERLTFDLDPHVNYTDAAVEQWVGTVGAVMPGGGWRELDLRSRVQRRWNLQYRVNLRVGYVINNKPAGVSARRYITSSRGSHLDTFTRHGLMLFSYTQPVLAFNWTAIRSREWGEVVNGSWRGVLGAINEGLIDVCASPMFIKKHRLSVSDNAGLTSIAELPTLFRQPTVSAASLSQFAEPLSPGSWACACAGAALMALLTVAVAHVQRRYLKYCELDCSFGTVLLEFVNVFYLDGEWGGRRLWAGRAGALAACSLGLLLQQFYGASLLSSLLAPPPRSITDLKSLLASTLDYKAEDILYHHLFFQKWNQAARPEIARLYREKLTRGPLPPFLPVEEGLERVRQGNFAFQTTAPYAYKVAARWEAAARCALDVLHVHPPGPLYTMAAKHSPYTQHLRTIWVSLRTGGVLAYEKRRWYGERPRCQDARLDLAPVGAQLAPAFAALAALGGISLLVLVGEMLMAAAARKRLDPLRQRLALGKKFKLGN